MRSHPRQYHAERLFQATYDDYSRYRHYHQTADQAFDEFKKILILAGAFFFILIICIMSKLQVETEDVLRWSPIVWLVGVCIAGAVMNLLFYCQKKYKERKRARNHLEQDLLYHLPIPRSFPCLAPPPHVDCCRAQSTVSLPTYEDVITRKNEEDVPPAYSDAVAMLPREERVINEELHQA